MSRRKAALAAALVMSIALPAAAKPICYQPAEIRAMQFRQLQVELMVAALKCRGVDPSFRDKYAGYIGKVGPALNSNAQQLRAMFTRLGKGAAQLDRYMTDLSNEASMRSLHMEDYCERQDQLFATVLSMKPQEIEAFAADTVEKPHSPASCQQPPAPKPVKQVKAKEKAVPRPDDKSGVKG